MKAIILLMYITLTAALAADSTVMLSEGLIRELISKNPPSTQQIESSFLMAKQQYLMSKDALSLRLEGEAQRYRSKERLLNNFDGGVTIRQSLMSVGLVKPTKYGMELGLKATSAKITNAFIEGASTSGISLTLSMDLLQDFLGRSTNNSLKAGALAVKRAEKEKKAALKSFESNVRKLYWALVANNEQKKLIADLVALANKQYKQAIRRKRSGVADIGEVSRYRSQLSTRKASLLSLKYKRGEILKSLKELLPELGGKEIELAGYSVQGTVKKVLACSARIRSHQGAPMQFTPFDEIVGLYEEEEILQDKVIQAYDDPSLKLTGEYSNIGRGFGMEASRDDLSDNPRARTAVGIKLSIPIGGAKNTTKEVSEKLNAAKFRAAAKGQLAKIKAFHSETADIIGILKEVVKNQKETNLYLGKSLKQSRKKFKQARISLQELISEQDSLLQSSLDEIETNLTVINTLMDYFSIYTDIPCELNRI